MKLLRGIELKGTYKVTFSDLYVEVYNDKGYNIYLENSDGYWYKREYDKRGNQIYFENSDGYWYKREYDKRGNQIYFENSYGEFLDNRVKELTVEEIEKLLGYKIKIKGEKK